MKKILRIILKLITIYIAVFIALIMINIGMWEITHTGNALLFVAGVFAIPTGITIFTMKTLDAIDWYLE